jgi:hypothetical protein
MKAGAGSIPSGDDRHGGALAYGLPVVEHHHRDARAGV